MIFFFDYNMVLYLVKELVINDVFWVMLKYGILYVYEYVFIDFVYKIGVIDICFKKLVEILCLIG